MGGNLNFRTLIASIYLIILSCLSVYAHPINQTFDFDLFPELRKGLERLPQKSLGKLDATFANARALYELLITEVESQISEFGLDSFNQEVRDNSLVITDDRYGELKLKIIAPQHGAPGGFSVRIEPKDSSLSILIADKSLYGSAQIRRFKAIAHINEGKLGFMFPKGQDVLLLWSDGTTEVSKKPRFLSRRWWSDYVLATFEKPTSGDVLLAQYCAVAQVGIACVAGSYKAAILTFLFAQGIGVNSKSYMNWLKRGGKIAQTLKGGLLSALFAVPLLVWTHHGFGIFDLNTWTGRIVVGNLILNSLGKNLAKSFVYEPVYIRQELKHNRGRIKILGWTTPINRARFEFQTASIGTFTLKLLDILFGIQGVVTITKGLLYGSIYPFQKFSLWYAKKHGLEKDKLEIMEKRWKKMILPVTMCKNFFRFLTSKQLSLPHY